MAEPRFWQSAAHPLSIALRPLAAVYGLLEAANRKLTQAQHPGKPVICVGNLTAGGGGKTPTVRLLAQWLADDGLHPAILSRGYGGQEKGPLKVDGAHHTAAQIGDEPLMLAGDWPVYIGADRMASLRLAVRDGHDVLIKDDGFQNPAMAHHFNLVVVDGTSGLGNQCLLPAGPLRQKLDVALAKLDALLIIGAPTHASLPVLVDKVKAKGKPVFHGAVTASPPASLATDKPVAAFCGIAKPEKFQASLDGLGYRIAALTSFADHHMFSEAEAARLLDSPHPLVTTEKDMARLRGAKAGSARAKLAETAHVLQIALHVEDAAALRQTMQHAMAAKQANQLYTSY